jgi:hypothetical protein
MRAGDSVGQLRTAVKTGTSNRDSPRGHPTGTVPGDTQPGQSPGTPNRDSPRGHPTGTVPGDI